MTTFIIGQCFGAIAIILGFVSYQVRTQRQILFMQSMVAVSFVIHYLLIGSVIGAAMNAINIVRNVAYDYRNRKEIKSKLIPIIFTAVQMIMGIVTWDAWYSVFIFAGIVINTWCMSMTDPQNVRKSILVTSPMIIVYDAFALSIGGVIYETVAWISAGIGVYRNRKSKRTDVGTK